MFFSYFAFHTVAGHALFYPIFIIINHRVQIPSKVIHAMLAEYIYSHAYIYLVHAGDYFRALIIAQVAIILRTRNSLVYSTGTGSYNMHAVH